MRIHLDFETKSIVDLKAAGAHVYASDPSTEPLCMAYRFDDEPVQLWKKGEPLPPRLKKEIEAGHTLVCHNAAFEFLIWNFCCVPKFGWPPIPVSQFDCTMIRAYSMGLPGTLENAAKSVGLKAEKDMKGNRVMLQLSKPRAVDKKTGAITWWLPEHSTPKLDIRAKYEHLYRYCKQDVVVECELDKRLLPLSPEEKDLWVLDQKINARGVYCDIETVKVALEIIKIEQKRLNGKMGELTEGMVGTCNSHMSLAKWLNFQKIFNGKKDSDGVLLKVESVDKASVLDMLELSTISPLVKTVLKLRQEAAKNSTAKLKKMISGASSDQRVRGCFQFNGAASTQRWSGRRVQLHNMPRPTIKQPEIEEIVLILKDKSLTTAQKTSKISLFHGAVLPRISDCIRAMLTAAPGKKLISVDFAQIESRVLAWLAGEEKKLGVFRGHGLFYEDAATKIYGVQLHNVDTKQRLVGKVSELSLGFGGGVGAFQSMAKNYFVKVPDREAEQIKVAWRLGNPAIVRYWYDLERAAIAATQSPGQKFAVGPRERRVIYLRKGSFLFCRLPSGRAICYPYPKIETKYMLQDPKTKRYRKFDAKKDAHLRSHAIEKMGLTYMGEENFQFVKKSGYGGLLCENVTQATARDLLAEGITRFEKAGYEIVMHVHDEVVPEVDKNFGTLQEAEDLLCVVPAWAKDLPIKAAGWVGHRYRK